MSGAEAASTNERRAVVSLLYGASASNLLNLLTMLNSAKRLDADRLVMVPQGDKALGYRTLFESYGIQIVEVPPIGVPKTMLGKGDASHWGNVFTKFRAFNLTSYDKVLLIDSDAFFTGSGDPTIFEDCGEHELCLVEDPMPELYIKEDCPDAPDMCRQLNTGVMVFTPSAKLLDDVLQELEKDTHTYHFPDQQFLSRYLRIKGSSLDWKLLDPQWNNCGHDPSPALEGKPWVGHFCQSWKDKDHKNFRFAFCTESSSCSVTLRAWQGEVRDMDPCLGQDTAATCQARPGCGWRSTFCLDARLDAKGITFDQEPAP